eukprot:scaffold16816_cov118-Skeletonema_dohrnii-CCMP3373.AAC.4
MAKRTTMTDLIAADFPHQRNRQVVQFADVAQLYIVEHHEDNEQKNISRRGLWYNKSDYDSMKVEIWEDVLKVLSRDSDGCPFNYSGDDEASVEESSGCCIGIERFLTPACTLEVKSCRARCIYAVLAKQLNQSSSEFDIALASIAQTRGSALRARNLGRFHRDSNSLLHLQTTLRHLYR